MSVWKFVNKADKWGKNQVILINASTYYSKLYSLLPLIISNVIREKNLNKIISYHPSAILFFFSFCFFSSRVLCLFILYFCTPKRRRYFIIYYFNDILQRSKRRRSDTLLQSLPCINTFVSEINYHSFSSKKLPMPRWVWKMFWILRLRLLQTRTLVTNQWDSLSLRVLHLRTLNLCSESWIFALFSKKIEAESWRILFVQNTSPDKNY
jgi:hypothetical protein